MQGKKFFLWHKCTKRYSPARNLKAPFPFSLHTPLGMGREEEEAYGRTSITFPFRICKGSGNFFHQRGKREKSGFHHGRREKRRQQHQQRLVVVASFFFSGSLSHWRKKKRKGLLEASFSSSVFPLLLPPPSSFPFALRARPTRNKVDQFYGLSTE